MPFQFSCQNRTIPPKDNKRKINNQKPQIKKKNLAAEQKQTPPTDTHHYISHCNNHIWPLNNKQKSGYIYISLAHICCNVHYIADQIPCDFPMICKQTTKKRQQQSRNWMTFCLLLVNRAALRLHLCAPDSSTDNSHNH